MSIEKFTPDELEVMETAPGFFGSTVEWYKTPITSKENIKRMYEGKTPMWMPFTGEITNLMIDCDPENKARSNPEGGIDGWGVEWIFVKQAGGAMVKPGNPKVPDIEHWEDYLTIPDPDTWDWEDCYERNKDKKRDDRMFMISSGSCLFERLIAVMDFANAAMALIDDEQKPHVHRFFRAVNDSRIKYYKNMIKWFGPDMVNFNDDWGSQRAEFFSVDTAKEMLVPYVKELGDFVHSQGLYFDLHCCGFVENFVPLFIEEGFNSWGGQPLNDKAKLKKLYGDSNFIFTSNFDYTPDMSDEELTKAVADFMADIGYDNRLFFGGNMGDSRLHKAVYEASRLNYDRLVAEGKAVL